MHARESTAFFAPYFSSLLYPVLEKATFKSNALHLLPKKVTNYVT